jgi:2-keto-4-pentenoate hydratase/2-oxohepta-3-ene-1,7-dioic acid hydratase in catechol pathway
MTDRIYRFDDKGTARHAVERDGLFFEMTGDWLGPYRAGRELGRAEAPGRPPAGLRILAPLVPSKIVGIGLNYRAHAGESGKPVPVEPLIFLKPSTAVVAAGEPIRIPANAGRVDHEAELAVVIGRRASKVPRARAADYIFGVTCSNDVTAREMQRRGVQYSHCKGYDTFAPLGPCISVGLDPSALQVEGWVNGERRQAGSSADMIFPVDELVAYISSVMTLLPGDIISTGTPAGIGPLRPGDTVTVKVEGVGELSNPVVGE